MWVGGLVFVGVGVFGVFVAVAVFGVFVAVAVFGGIVAGAAVRVLVAVGGSAVAVLVDVGGSGVRVAVGGGGVGVRVAVGGTGVGVRVAVAVGVGVFVGVEGTGVGEFVGVAVGTPTVMVTERTVCNPVGSVARSVTTCVPVIKSLRENEVPTPRPPPWMFDVQNMNTPPNGPVSGSIAVAENRIVEPGANDDPLAGERIVTTGGRLPPAAASRGPDTPAAAVITSNAAGISRWRMATPISSVLMRAALMSHAQPGRARLPCLALTPPATITIDTDRDT